jgi:hypothetical protein
MPCPRFGLLPNCSIAFGESNLRDWAYVSGRLVRKLEKRRYGIADGANRRLLVKKNGRENANAFDGAETANGLIFPMLARLLSAP